MLTAEKLRLTGNQLKLLALVTMTCDHIGVTLFPQVLWLRIVGRLALPIFAYMIAEGCRHTRSRKRYLLSIVAVAALCQAVYLVAMGSLYMCIMVTFSLSVALIYLWDYAKTRPAPQGGFLVLAALCVTWVLCEAPLFPGTDFHIDYGIFGVLLPVLIYMGRNGLEAFAMAALGLVMLNLSMGVIQWFSLFALIPLAFYDGTRGKAKLKYLFYIYYPAHLAVIWLIGLVL
jgi:hypothetical protein